MATLTWRCEAKPRFLQTHLGDKQRCTQKHLGRDRGTPERRVETLKRVRGSIGATTLSRPEQDPHAAQSYQ
jgi:hypothetical protein